MDIGQKLLSAWNRGSGHFFLLLCFTYSFTVTAKGDAGKVRSGFDPLCHDNPSINCVFLDHSAQICSAFPESEETKSYCPRYCGLCGDQTTVRSSSSTVAGSVDHITSGSAHHVTTGGSGHVTGAPAGTTTAPFTGPCVDDPAAKCADLDHTAHICTLYRNDVTTRTSCPKYCGLCGGQVTTGGSGHVTGAPAGTTTAPFTGPCVDDPAAKCADLDHTAHICTLYRDDLTTRTSCPKYCGLCGGQVTTGGSGHVTGAPAGTTTASFTGPCVDDPAAKCADLDHTAHICTLYRNDLTTRTSCPKYCGLCGGHVTTGGSDHVTGAPAGTTTAPFTGPCVDDPAAKCADLDHTAHICTLYRNDLTTRTSCPKYCGLCGDGQVTTGGSGHVTGAPAGTTTAPFTGPCVDDPAAKCADLDHTAHICTLYRNDLTTRTSCPKYCGLCGGQVTTGGSGHVTGAPAGTTTASFTGPCVDDPAAKCADLDHTAHICTLYRNDPTTRTSCPNYCGLCGGHVTTGGSGHVTGAPAGTTTAPFTGPCVDDPAAKCADLDHTAHICTLYRDDQTTRTSCPKYCGLCGDGKYTGGVVSTDSIHSTREHTTLSHTSPSTTRRTTQTTSEAQTTVHLYTEHVNETTSLPKTTVIFKTTGSVHESTIGSETSTNRQTSTQHISTTEARGPSTTVSMESVMLEAFHKEDLNKDGRVSFAEFERAWMILDVNGDGRVTEYEYSRGTHFSRLIASEVFSYIDGDHNLVITLQELPHIYTLFDTDYSGSIEKEEYIKEYLRIYNHIKNNLE